MKRATNPPAGAKAAEKPRRRWSGKLWLAAGLAIVVMLWLVYWYGANQIAAAVLDRATAAASARGYSAECEGVESGGFPLSLDIACSRARFSGNADGLLATIDGFSATTPLYRPGRVDWFATGPLVVDAPMQGIDLSATWQLARSSLDAGFGGLSMIETSIKDLRVELPPTDNSLPSGPMPFGGLALAQADLSISPQSADRYRLSATASAIALDTGGDADLPEIDLRADLSALDFGSSLGLDPRATLIDWLAGGGILRIDDLTLVTETVSTSYTGKLSLSPEGKVSGEINAVIAGIEAVPDLVESFRPGSREKIAQIVAAIVAFTRPVETSNGPAREMKLLVRDSVVSIGILPIGVIPTIAF